MLLLDTTTYWTHQLLPVKVLLRQHYILNTSTLLPANILLRHKCIRTNQPLSVIVLQNTTTYWTHQLLPVKVLPKHHCILDTQLLPVKVLPKHHYILDTFGSSKNQLTGTCKCSYKTPLHTGHTNSYLYWFFWDTITYWTDQLLPVKVLLRHYYILDTPTLTCIGSSETLLHTGHTNSYLYWFFWDTITYWTHQLLPVKVLLRHYYILDTPTLTCKGSSETLLHIGNTSSYM